MPGLQMADVRRLAIALPEPDEQAAISQEVDDLFSLQDRIRELRSELAHKQGLIWPERAKTGARIHKSDAESARKKTLPSRKSAS